ncbi:hypothetical protein ACFQ6B_37095 [Streptomyces wedmorensis]|uniref:Uncharacterized protein n=1 Tax=Streptomyces wedmorensis TaxID=43759 RepID=A0ABW6IXJ6_STRWE
MPFHPTDDHRLHRRPHPTPQPLGIAYAVRRGMAAARLGSLET